MLPRFITLLLALSSWTILAAQRPNIVFFFIDDLGWTDLGFMGSDYYQTPNIDGLAARSLIFTDAYAAAPNCAPSRASLMSGRYTPHHGVFTVGDPARGQVKQRKLIPTENRTDLDESFVTLAEALKSSGYVTAAMGKWHLGKDPRSQGFDVNVAGREWGSPSGGGYHSPYQYPNLQQKQKGEYLTDRLTDEACAFVEKHAQEPFFLYLSHYAVHTPIQGRPDLVSKNKSRPKGQHHRNAEYAAMVESVDESVGKVLGTLKRLELEENTVVIFFSDNGGYGGATSNHPLRGAKGMLYEGGIREPLTVLWPGVTPKGARCSEPVIGIDLYPTLLEITGTAKPDGTFLDGLSLAPLLRDPQASLKRDAIYWHFPCYLQGSGGRDANRPFRTTPAGAIRMGDWKMIQYFEDGGVELFHLGRDLSETTNLAGKEPEQAARLLKKLQDWQREHRAPIPTTPNPFYDPVGK